MTILEIETKISFEVQIIISIEDIFLYVFLLHFHTNALLFASKRNACYKSSGAVETPTTLTTEILTPNRSKSTLVFQSPCDGLGFWDWDPSFGI